MSAIKTYTPETLAKEIKSAVEWLKEEDCGCVTLKLNGTLAVCIGWSDGFDPDDDTVIHSKTEPTYAICAAIKAWGSDDLGTDLDYIDAPYYEDGSIYDTEMSISPDENYEWLAKSFLGEFDILKEMDIDERGRIYEHCYLVSAYGRDDHGGSVEFNRDIGWFDTYEKAYGCFVKLQGFDWDNDFKKHSDLSEIEISVDEYIKDGKGKEYFDTRNEWVIYK